MSKKYLSFGRLKARRLVTGLKAAIVPNANHIAEFTGADFVTSRSWSFWADRLSA